MTKLPRFAGRKQSPGPLVQMRPQESHLLLQLALGCHGEKCMLNASECKIGARKSVTRMLVGFEFPLMGRAEHRR
jgi:hypothetical protein